MKIGNIVQNAGGIMNDILKEIELDISGDWEKLAEEFKVKEDKDRDEEKILKNKQRIDCSSLNRFYTLLIRILQSWGSHGDRINPEAYSSLRELIFRMFSDQQNWPNSMPDSFDKVWQIFCDPRNYSCDKNVSCRHCNKEYDIFYQENNEPIEPVWQLGTDMEAINHHMIRHEETACCPSCGCRMVVYINRKIVGIFSSDVHDGEK